MSVNHWVCLHISESVFSGCVIEPVGVSLDQWVCHWTSGCVVGPVGVSSDQWVCIPSPNTSMATYEAI